MKRRGFLAGLFAIPAAVKAIAETKAVPEPLKVYREAVSAPAVSRNEDEWFSCITAVSYGEEISMEGQIFTTDRMK